MNAREMFGQGKKQIEIDRLRDAEAALTQQVADLEGEKKILNDALAALRTELQCARDDLNKAEKEIGSLRLEIEREHTLAGELRSTIETYKEQEADFEREAEEIGLRIDEIAAERAKDKAKITNLKKTVEELRARLEGKSRKERSLNFEDIEEEAAAAAPREPGRRPYGEPYRPSVPTPEADRDWLINLPPF